jgi:hypothetical protein
MSDPKPLTARRVGLMIAKGFVVAILFGAWAFGYHFLALGACLDCSTAAAITYAVIAAILAPLFVLWLVNSPWGRIRIYLRRIRRPSLRRLLVMGVLWGLGMGLIVFAVTGAAWRIAAVLPAWLVCWWAFPRLFGRLYRPELELS